MEIGTICMKGQTPFSGLGHKLHEMSNPFSVLGVHFYEMSIPFY